MMAFLAANFNLPTVIVASIVLGGAGWLLYRTRKSGGSCGGCSGGCSGGCHGCDGHCCHGK